MRARWRAALSGMVIGLLGCLPTAARADAESLRLLRLALRGPIVAFEGVQQTQVAVGDRIATATVRIRGDGTGAILREYSGASGYQLLQMGPQVWKKVGADGWLPLPVTTDRDTDRAAAMIEANYRILVGKPEQRLGRRTIPIQIVPRQSCNPSRQLWLDPQTGLLLEDRLLAPDGRLRSATTFTTLTLRPQPAALIQKPARLLSDNAVGPFSFRPADSAEAVERQTGLPVPRPAYVPSGYRPTLYGVMTTGSGRQMPAVRYSDGLSAFTIYQRGRGPGGGGRGLGRGADRQTRFQSDVQQSIVEAQRAQRSYLLIGDLAESELLKVAASLP
jgi:hypothetical protein